MIYETAILGGTLVTPRGLVQTQINRTVSP